MDLEFYMKESYHTALTHGFWDADPVTGKLPSIDEKLALIVSELAEALEAHRKIKHTTCVLDDIDCSDDFKKDFEAHVKDTFQDELADACIRIFDLCARANVELTVIPVILNGTVCSEHLFGIMRAVTLAGIDLTNMMCQATSMIFMLAEKQAIDIKKHIDLKMRYNASRGYKHGKAY